MKIRYNDFLNESVRDLMKGKSDEEIKKSLDELKPIDKLNKSIENDYFDGIKSALKDLPKSYTFRKILIRLIDIDKIEVLKYIINNAKISTSDMKDILWFANNKKKITNNNKYDEIINLLKTKNLDNIYGKKNTNYDDLLDLGCETNDYELIKKSIDNGATVKDKRIPTSVIKNNNLKIAKLLLDNGAIIYKDLYDHMSLMTAIANDNVDMIKLFLQYNGIIIDDYIKREVIEYIEKEKHVKIVELLVEKYPEFIEEIKNKINLYKKYLPE